MVEWFKARPRILFYGVIGVLLVLWGVDHQSQSVDITTLRFETENQKRDLQEKETLLRNTKQRVVTKIIYSASGFKESETVTAETETNETHTDDRRETTSIEKVSKETVQVAGGGLYPVSLIGVFSLSGWQAGAAYRAIDVKLPLMPWIVGVSPGLIAGKGWVDPSFMFSGVATIQMGRKP